MIKYILQLAFGFILSSFLIVACSDDDDSANNGASNGNADDCISYTVVYEDASFTASCADMNDSLTWDFGDGATSKKFTPTHTYQDTGLFNVKLKIERGQRVILNYSTIIRIKPTCRQCACNFPLDSTTSFFSFCSTSVKADEWCTTDCYSNQFCKSCAEI